MVNEGDVMFPLRDNAVSVRFIASADVHLGKRLYSIPELEEDLRDNFVRLCDLAISKQVEYLVICGDLFEDNLPSPVTIATVKEQVERLYKHDVRLVGIAGDHDKPISGESWCRVSGIAPITIEPSFTGFDYYNTSSGIGHVMDLLKEKRDVAKVQWIFLHCQFPQLFRMTEDKKKIDFSEVRVFDTFPNLQGILAGDIHTYSEGELTEKDKSAYIGYCGSLGVTDVAEAVQSRSVIYCDGHQLLRIPFPQRRDILKVNFRGDSYKTFSADPLVRKYKGAAYRPVFSVDWDSDSEPFFDKLKPLYTVGFVRMHQTIRMSESGKEEVTVNIRSEMKTEEKVDAALKECCEGDQLVYSLLSEALSATDPKTVFDAFKKKQMP